MSSLFTYSVLSNQLPTRDIKNIGEFADKAPTSPGYVNRPLIGGTASTKYVSLYGGTAGAIQFDPVGEQIVIHDQVLNDQTHPMPSRSLNIELNRCIIVEGDLVAGPYTDINEETNISTDRISLTIDDCDRVSSSSDGCSLSSFSIQNKGSLYTNNAEVSISGLTTSLDGVYLGGRLYGTSGVTEPTDRAIIGSLAVNLNDLVVETQSDLYLGTYCSTGSPKACIYTVSANLDNVCLAEGSTIFLGGVAKDSSSSEVGVVVANITGCTAGTLVTGSGTGNAKTVTSTTAILEVDNDFEAIAIGDSTTGSTATYRLHIKEPVSNLSNIYKEASILWDNSTGVIEGTDKELSIQMSSRNKRIVLSNFIEMPADYERLESIQTDGKSYIDTGFEIPEEGVLYEIDFNWSGEQSLGETILGSRSQSSPYYGHLVYVDTGERVCVYVADKTTQVFSPVKDKFYTTNALYLKDSSSYIGESLLDNSIYATKNTTPYIQPNSSVYLLVGNNDGVATLFAKSIRLFGCRIISHSGVKLHDYIPCLRKVDNKPGLWDRVTGEFLTNAGSGEFNYIGSPALTFTASETGSTVVLNAVGSPVVSGLRYRLNDDDIWRPYTCGDVITLNNVGDTVHFYNTNRELSTSSADYAQFSTTGELAVSGTIQSLLYWNSEVPDYAFYSLFKDNSCITSLPTLPASAIGSCSYAYMCSGCSGISSIDLSSLKDISAEGCLAGMLSGCSSLSEIKAGFSTWNNTESWVSNVADYGTFYRPYNLSEEYGDSRIPENWDTTIVYPKDLTVWEITIPEGGDTAGYEVNNSTYSTVDWGDGTVETFTTNGRHTHFFDAGTYTIGVTSDGTYVTAAGYSGGYAPWAKYCTRIFHWSELINDFRYMCSTMSNLEEVPSSYKTPVANILGAFYSCVKLRNLPMLDLTKLTNSNAQFFAQGCRTITSVPPYDTSKIQGYYMFLESCSNLEQIPDLNYSNATNMQHMFRTNSKMRGYARPEMFWENPNNPKYNVYTFNGCIALDNFCDIPTTWGGPKPVFNSTEYYADIYTTSVKLDMDLGGYSRSGIFESYNLPDGLRLSSDGGVIFGDFKPGVHSFEVSARCSYVVDGVTNYSSPTTVTITLIVDGTNKLPAEYTRVKGLRSDGAAYIDTGLLMPEEGLTFSMAFNMIQTHSTSCLFGSRTQLSPYSGFIAGYIYGNFTLRCGVAGSFRANDSSPFVLAAGEDYALDVRYYKNATSGVYTVSESANGGLELTITSTTSYIQTTGEYPIFLYASNNAGTPNLIDRNTRITKFKVTDVNGNLVSELIPCVRNSDDVAGFYDIVRDLFLTNAGGGEFLVGEETDDLPSIYRKVDSLQSDGQAYINTGFVMPEDGATFEIDFTCRKWLASNVIYGSRSQTSPYPGYLLYLYGNLRLTSMLAGNVMREVNGDTNPAPQLTLNGVYNVRTSYYKDGNGFGFSESINGEPTVYKTGIATTYVQPGDCPLFIFASNNGGTPNNVSSSVDVHSFKISTTDGQKLMDLIPCVRKEDSVPGMWDKVSRRFLTNAASSGSFEYTLSTVYNPLTFTAEEAGSTVKLVANGAPTVSGLRYKLGSSSSWYTYTPGTVITLENVGDTVMFYNTEETLSNGTANYVQTVVTGKIAASGDLQSMLNYSSSIPNYGFYRFFYGCSGLTSLPEFSASILGAAAYYAVCQYCSGLNAVKLILPGQTIANACYIGAFNGATGLEEVEIVSPAIDGGYNNLNLAFSGCTTLKKITVHFKSWAKDWQNNDTFWTNWVQNVSPTGTFYKPSALPEEYGPNRIPEGWTVVNID